MRPTKYSITGAEHQQPTVFPAGPFHVTVGDDQYILEHSGYGTPPWRLVCTATVVHLVPALGWESMHIVLGFCSRAIILQKNEGDQNGRVPELQECTPNLSTFICAIKKVDTGKLFPLLGSPS